MRDYTLKMWLQFEPHSDDYSMLAELLAEIFLSPQYQEYAFVELGQELCCCLEECVSCRAV